MLSQHAFAQLGVAQGAAQYSRSNVPSSLHGQSEGTSRSSFFSTKASVPNGMAEQLVGRRYQTDVLASVTCNAPLIWRRPDGDPNENGPCWSSPANGQSDFRIRYGNPLIKSKRSRFAWQSRSHSERVISFSLSVSAKSRLPESPKEIYQALPRISVSRQVDL